MRSSDYTASVFVIPLAFDIRTLYLDLGLNIRLFMFDEVIINLWVCMVAQLITNTVPVRIRTTFLSKKFIGPYKEH